MKNPPINLINGQIITLDPALPITNSIYINKGKIFSLGERIKNAKIIDLQGATVVPGFIDAHFHLANLGKSLQELQLTGISSVQSIIDAVVNKSKTFDKNNWILGRGWDQNIWGNSNFPASSLLDEAIKNHPVVLTRIDGHAIWINKVVRDLIGYNENNNPLLGGEVINNCIFIDNAMEPVHKILPQPDENTMLNYLINGCNYAIQYGITQVHDAWQNESIIKGLESLDKNNNLPIRCYGMIDGKDSLLVDEWINRGKLFSDKITVRAVKAFIDGSLGSRGAALLDPYCDDPSNKGLILLTKDEFKLLSKKCYDHEFQLCTHAIGDRGNRMVLNIYADILKGKNNKRWRIEHAQMVANEDIPMFVNNNIIPSMQPSHCTSDMEWMNNRIGSKRLNRISRWKTFINHGLRIAGGSDCPIEKGNPILEFYAAVSRKNVNGQPNQGWQSQEKVSRTEALKMLTTWAAYGAFEENKRGLIKIGFDADLTVLSNNILTCPENEIPKTDVLFTIVGGKIVYRR